MRLPDPDTVTAAIREAAELDVLPRFRALGEGEVREKAPGDVVTQADIDAEHRLTRSPTGLLPGSDVVGEEAFAKNEAVLDRLAGRTRCGSSIRSTYRQLRVRQGTVLHDGGACCCRRRAPDELDPRSGQRPDRDRGTRGRGLLSRYAAAGSAATTDRRHERIDQHQLLAARAAPETAGAPSRFPSVLSLRCAGLDFLQLSLGERHFSVFRRLWPWDHVPGVLLFSEAGGAARRMDGEPYRASDRVYGLLSAADEEAWQSVRDYLMAD